eukprot:TRINITY_DN7492_c0_g4_i1.p1 TRINITY_DN7492_c0_g4~~TRINITY_DN7492_c0_g4_i1.p1  ORF type:complete len:1029 (+),score=345.62 TRINITY_DN7492_c0_g4_i1:83-3169(+)
MGCCASQDVQQPPPRKSGPAKAGAAGAKPHATPPPSAKATQPAAPGKKPSATQKSSKEKSSSPEQSTEPFAPPPPQPAAATAPFPEPVEEQPKTVPAQPQPVRAEPAPVPVGAKVQQPVPEDEGLGLEPGWYLVVGTQGAVVRDHVEKALGKKLVQVATHERLHITEIVGVRGYAPEYKGWVSILTVEGHELCRRIDDDLEEELRPGWYVVVGSTGAVLRDHVDKDIGKLVGQLQTAERVIISEIVGHRGYAPAHEGWLSVINSEGHEVCRRDGDVEEEAARSPTPPPAAAAAAAVAAPVGAPQPLHKAPPPLTPDKTSPLYWYSRDNGVKAEVPKPDPKPHFPSQSPESALTASATELTQTHGYRSDSFKSVATGTTPTATPIKFEAPGSRRGSREFVPGWFKVIGKTGAVLRDHVDLSIGQLVATLAPDDCVYISEVQGRRGYAPAQRAWASVTNAKGEPILDRMASCTDPPPPGAGVPAVHFEKKEAANQSRISINASFCSTQSGSVSMGSVSMGQRPDERVAALSIPHHHTPITSPELSGHAGVPVNYNALYVEINEAYEMEKPVKHERYVIEAKQQDENGHPVAVSSVSRKFAELKAVFDKLTKIEQHQGVTDTPLPKVPTDGKGYMSKLFGRNKSSAQLSPLDERKQAFQDLFNAVLQNAWLSAHPEFRRLLGADDVPGMAGTPQKLGSSNSFVEATPRGPGGYQLPPFMTPRVAAVEQEPLSSQHWSTWQKIGKPLGKGAFGVVYLAQLCDARQVAIKSIDLNEAPDNGSKASFEQEFSLMRKLSHPNIVCYLGHHWSASTTLLIALEFVTGGSIADLVKKVEGNCLQPMVMRRYVQQILVGLQYLHSGDATRPPVVHRDIKGDNVLVGRDGEIKLADFGCSKLIGENLKQSGANPTTLYSHGNRGAATMVGTPFWMAPEVIQPQENDTYGTKCDIWSLGCTVIEMFGKQPWGEMTANSPWEVMYNIANSDDGPQYPAKCTSPALREFLDLCFVRNARHRASANFLLTSDYITCSDSDLIY